jgi:putative membrane protein
MLFELLIALLLGILFGTFTGLIPGIHINLIGALILASSIGITTQIKTVYLVTFITSLAITHTFLDFIPSVFLGCPDTDTELSILPGHKLLKKGRGHSAVALTAYGSLAAILLIILLAFPSLIIIPKVHKIILPLLPYLLISIIFLLIFLEKRKIKAIKVIILTGILGLIVLNIEKMNQPLLPLLTGLFGASSIILSIKNKTKIPKQKITLFKTKLFKPLLGATLAAPLCSFLPGMGSGQAAVIGNTLTKNNPKQFLVLLGATNTLVMGFSFISLYTISKTRTGAAVALQGILGIGNFEQNYLILILVIATLTGILSFFLTLKISKIFAEKITKINYTLLSIITLFILFLLVSWISGILGILVFIISTSTGIYCINTQVRRTHMMGCLLIPTIIFYLF